MTFVTLLTGSWLWPKSTESVSVAVVAVCGKFWCPVIVPLAGIVVPTVIAWLKIGPLAPGSGVMAVMVATALTPLVSFHATIQPPVDGSQARSAVIVNGSVTAACAGVARAALAARPA